MCVLAYRNRMPRNEMDVPAASPMAPSFPFVFQSSDEMRAACALSFSWSWARLHVDCVTLHNGSYLFPLSALFSRIDTIVHFHFEILCPGVSLLLF